MPPLKTNVISSVPEDDDTDLREDLEVGDEEFDGEELPENVIPPVVPQPRNENAEIERRARNLGWHPKDEYLGPPGKWVDAATFIKRGEDILPVLRDNNKRLLERTDRQTTEIYELKKSLTEQSEVLKELREIARTSNDRGYARAVAELKSQQRDAVASADTEKFEKVTEQIEEIERARATTFAPAPKQPVPEKPSVAPEIEQFISENDWFTADTVLNQAMQNEHVLLRRMKPGLSLEDNLAEAKEAVMSRFPDKFGQPNGSKTPRRAAAVAQPSGRPSSQNNKKDTTKIDSIEDPVDRAEAKAAFTKWKRQMPDYTEEEYMKNYMNPHSDILTDLRAKKEARRGK